MIWSRLPHSTRLMATHGQSPGYINHPATTASFVLNTVARANFKSLDHEKLQKSLFIVLGQSEKELGPFLGRMPIKLSIRSRQQDTLATDASPYRKSQLSYIRINERREELSPNGFINGLKNTQVGLEEVSRALQFVKSAQNDAKSLVDGVKDFLDSLKEALASSPGVSGIRRYESSCLSPRVSTCPSLRDLL